MGAPQMAAHSATCKQFEATYQPQPSWRNDQNTQ